MFSRNHLDLLTLRKLFYAPYGPAPYGSMGPFLTQKVGDSKSKHGPWNPEKLIPLHALIERYDKKEGRLTTISRKKAIGKYHRTIPYYNLIHITCEPFRLSYSEPFRFSFSC